jgi:putative transposase
LERGRAAQRALMFAAMIRAAERWRAIKVTDFERRKMAAVRAELDHEYEARNGLATKPSAGNRTKLSSSPRT